MTKGREKQKGGKGKGDTGLFSTFMIRAQVVTHIMSSTNSSTISCDNKSVREVSMGNAYVEKDAEIHIFIICSQNMMCLSYQPCSWCVCTGRRGQHHVRVEFFTVAPHDIITRTSVVTYHL